MYKKAILYLMLMGLLTNVQPLSGAEEAEDNGATVLYSFNFFSLKPGHSISKSTLSLNADDTFSFDIKNQEIITEQITYTRQGVTFNAEIDFKTSEESHNRYKLTLSGVNILDVYIGGKATVKEFLENDYLVQEITFLFTGSKNSQGKRSPGLF